jgi:hypothetical protein
MMLLGSCPKCGTGIANADPRAGRASKCANPECNAVVVLARVKGEYNAARPCNDACQYARSTKCSCACGGGNHGCGYIQPYALRPQWVTQRDAEKIAAKAQRAVDKRNAMLVALVERVGTPAQRQWVADTSEAVATLARAAFFSSIAETLARYGSMTPRQADTAARVLSELAPKPAAPATPAPAAGRTVAAPTGTVQVVGTVASVRFQESQQEGRGTVKMRVQSDAGYGVWVAVPYAIREAVDPRFDSATALSGRLVGARVRFTAALTPSDGDPTFAWGHRPSDAELLAHPVAVSA